MAKTSYVLNGIDYSVKIISLRPNIILEVNDRIIKLELKQRVTGDTVQTAIINDDVTLFAAVNLNDSIQLNIDGINYKFEKTGKLNSINKNNVENNSVSAEMPGTVVQILVKNDEKIKEGDVLMTTESMKMLTNIIAPGDLTVKNIEVSEGDTFDKDTTLVTFRE